MKFRFLEWLGMLPKPERLLLLIFAGALALSFIALLANSYVQKTVQAPALGGSLTIGFIGNPHYINPVLAPANEVDRALIKLVYPSLMRYNHEGKLVPYLAKNFAIGDHGKLYDFFLKEGVTWEDGKPITAHDVVFTIRTVQDSKISSPLARLWQGVNVQALDDLTVRFTLSEPYAFFVQNLTGGILPRHIWEGISAENFSLSEYNKEPVGSGPYRFVNFTKSNSTITSLVFKANPTFFERAPYVPKITIRFYENTQALLKAWRAKEIDILGLSNGSSFLTDEDIKEGNLTSFVLPRYFAVFLNDKQNSALRKQNVREALLASIDRESIVSSLFHNHARIADSPIPAILSGYHTAEITRYPFNLDLAKKLLKEEGFSEKKPLTIELTVVNDEPLNRLAEMIKKNWSSAGIKVQIRSFDLSQLRDEALQKRSYQAFLFGQALALEPDPFSLWHSSQVQYPGLNLASYKNEKVDALLEELRKTFDEKRKKELFAEFQSIITKDLPALFLYSPHYLVLSQKDIKGVRSLPLSLPEDYLNQITDWHLYTKRVSK